MEEKSSGMLSEFDKVLSEEEAHESQSMGGTGGWSSAQECI